MIQNDHWKPDKKSEIPLYEQIKTYIIKKIEKGQWILGSKLPTQRQLSTQFEVNRSTIITATQELIAEGFLEGRTKGGTIVISKNPSNYMQNPPPDWISYVKSGTYQSNFDMVQNIYDYESRDTVIKLGTAELSPKLVSKDISSLIFNKLTNNQTYLGYEHPKGSYQLRAEVSSYLKSIDIYASPEQILIVSGALQALHLVSIGILYRGSTILTENPSYIYSINTFQSAKINLYGLPMDTLGIQIDRLVKARRQTNAGILYTIPCFQNPTSICMSSERMKKLLFTCKQERLPIIEDDTFRELYFNMESPKTLKSYDKNNLVLFVGSMSKTLLPGLRIGWVVGEEAVIERLADIKMQTDYGCSSLSQIAATELLSSGLYVAHLKNIRKELKLRRDIALKYLNKYFLDIASWHTPKGGFFIWLRLKHSIHMQKLFNNCLKKGLLINTGNIYMDKSNRHIRISYSYASYDQLEYGLKVLSQTIRQTY